MFEDVFADHQFSFFLFFFGKREKVKILISSTDEFGLIQGYVGLSS